MVGVRGLSTCQQPELRRPFVEKEPPGKDSVGQPVRGAEARKTVLWGLGVGPGAGGDEEIGEKIIAEGRMWGGVSLAAHC